MRRFRVGDEACTRPRADRIGTFADLIAIDRDDIARKPASLSMLEADRWICLDSCRYRRNCVRAAAVAAGASSARKCPEEATAVVDMWVA